MRSIHIGDDPRFRAKSLGYPSFTASRSANALARSLRFPCKGACVSG